MKRTEGQIAKDSSIIGSLKGQLNGIDTWVEKIALLVVENFNKSAEYQSKLKQVFMSGSKSFCEKCQETGLNVAPMEKLIRCNLGSRSSANLLMRGVSEIVPKRRR